MRRAFSLTELLVVVAIIAMLAALLAVGLAKSRDSARDAACRSNLRQIGLGLVVYGDTYKQFPVWLPEATTPDAMLLTLLDMPAALGVCPRDPDRRAMGYFYGHSGAGLWRLDDSEEVVSRDIEPWHDGRRFAIRRNTIYAPEVE